LPASASSVRIYITNSAGDSVHVIDLPHKVVQEIKNVVGAHGVNFSPDGARFTSATRRQIRSTSTTARP